MFIFLQGRNQRRAGLWRSWTVTEQGIYFVGGESLLAVDDLKSIPSHHIALEASGAM